MKPTWLLGAAAIAAFVLIRRGKLSRSAQIAGWIVAAAAAAVGAGLIQLPNLEELILEVGETLGAWTYLLVGVLAFLETGAFVGLVAPGETAVLVGGLVAGQGKISLPLLIALVWTCAVAGDLTSYLVGRRLGRDFLLRHGARLKITEERLQSVERFFDRHGGATILIGRFIGFVRALAPFVAGTARMPLRTFLPYDVLGAGAWSASLCVLGYVFWRSFHELTRYVSRGLIAFATLVALGLGVYWLIRIRRDPDERERVRAWLAERRERIPMPARLRPSGLGLELATTLALASVGGFGFFLIGDAVTHHQTGGADDMAASVASHLRDGTLVSVAKVVTYLGSSGVVAAIVLVTAGALAARGRRADPIALVAGFVLSFLAVHLIKAAYDRPRPSHPLVDTSLSSFPSGHSIYVVSLVACAVVLVRAGVGWVVRIGAVTIAIGLVVLVAATRVYLRAHYLSDVAGGVALGVAIWAIVASVALAATRVRHNGARSS